MALAEVLEFVAEPLEQGERTDCSRQSLELEVVDPLSGVTEKRESAFDPLENGSDKIGSVADEILYLVHEHVLEVPQFVVRVTGSDQPRSSSNPLVIPGALPLGLRAQGDQQPCCERVEGSGPDEADVAAGGRDTLSDLPHRRAREAEN